jgi:hypothetical protein
MGSPRMYRRQLWAWLGCLIAGSGLGIGARGLLLGYANVVVFAGALVGAGTGIVVASVMRAAPPARR